MKNLERKTAVITGGSRGIGRAVSVALAKQKANIFILYAGNDEAAADTRREVESYGVRCQTVKSDLSDPNCLATIQGAPQADILILNASVQYRKKWDEITLEEFDAQINCNLRSSLLLIQHYAPHMLEQQWGRIITIGSVQERKPHPDMLVYAASKAALTMLAKSLALQFAPRQVTVNAVAPGVILTDRNAEALQDEAYYVSVLDKIPLGICGEACDCVGIVELLCSEQGRYITGQNIFVDGGMGIK